MQTPTSSDNHIRRAYGEEVVRPARKEAEDSYP